MSTSSILFSGGLVVDGLGNAPVRGDVLVIGDRIAGIYKGAKRPRADRVLPACGGGSGAHLEIWFFQVNS